MKIFFWEKLLYLVSLKIVALNGDLPAIEACFIHVKNGLFCRFPSLVFDDTKATWATCLVEADWRVQAGAEFFEGAT